MTLRLSPADMIWQFRLKSFPLIVDALVALGRIQYKPETVVRGRWIPAHLAFNPHGDMWVTLCKNGNLCSDPDCRFHHLNHDYFSISQDFARCSGFGPHGTDVCSFPDECYYRHEEECKKAIGKDLFGYPGHPEIRAQFLENAKFILQMVFDYYSRTGVFDGNVIKRDAAFVGLDHMRFYPFYL